MDNLGHLCDTAFGDSRTQPMIWIPFHIPNRSEYIDSRAQGQDGPAVIAYSWNVRDKTGCDKEILN